ncbi:MAG: DUF2071 domain-containing protein [Acidobacteriota bacterium]
MNIDRITPATRPESTPLGHQQWRHLLFASWTCPDEILRAKVPQSLSLDSFNGKSYISIIPFTIPMMRATGIPPIPFASSMNEVNVRTYVHLQGSDPGVYFFSLDASNLAAVMGGRSVYHLPYFHAGIDLSVHEDASGGTVDFSSRRITPVEPQADFTASYGGIGTTAPARRDTLEHFLVERYFLYTEHDDRIFRAQVHHQPYPLQVAEVSRLDQTLIAAAGLMHDGHEPVLHYSAGVDVEIFGLQRAPLR